MTRQAFNRHMLVQCLPLSGGAAAVANSEDANLVHDWIAADRPFITRMRCQEDAVGHIPLGLPLPLANAKRRIALTIEPSLMKSIRPPPLLQDAVGALPLEFRTRVVKLSAELSSEADSVCVFGSLAWQFLTTKLYLHPKSDIDVIVAVSTIDQLYPVLQLLRDSDLTPGPRIDGEISTPRGDAVSWRELLSSSNYVLVKNGQGPRSMLRGQWLDQLRENRA
jgi:phosphoribosyl-dephospho-CoA transferase